MQQTGTRALSARELLDANRLYYDSLWSGAQLVDPGRFNTWPLIQTMLPLGGRRLEVAPGLRPRLPLEGTQFADVSGPALAKLARRGASVVCALVTSLPFPDAAFDLVCALDIVEHVDDDAAALGELARVARPGAAVLLSVPLHPELWNAFDEFDGHRRRYRPELLTELLGRHGLTVERSAVYGMQPRSSRLLDLGMWFLTNQRERALWWYNRVFMPLGLKFQKKLEFDAGLIAARDVDEILMICRKSALPSVSEY
jgi:SAM-dependent methyltransferase